MSVAFRVLFVCTGNICRSAFAERLLVARLRDRLGPDATTFEVRSAGVYGLDGQPMDRDTAAELVREGGDPEGFVSRPLTCAHVGWADLVLTAERLHRSAVLAELPEALPKTFTVLEFANLVEGIGAATEPSELVHRAARSRSLASIEDYDVPDPYGQAVEVHRTSGQTIATAVSVIAEALAAASVSSALG